MKKRFVLSFVFLLALLLACTAVLADDEPDCSHEWVETGVLRSEDVHDGSDIIVCYRCALCGEEHFETAPTDIPQECLYTMHDVVCANGTVSTTAVCVYCGKTRTFLSGPESIANHYKDDNGNLYSFSGDLSDIPESVVLNTDEAEETAEDICDELPDTDAPDMDVIPGGWSYFDCSDDIDETALSVFEQAMPLLTDGEYSPCALLGTQVVAGTNYAFLTFKTPYDTNVLPGYAVVYLYCNLSGDVSILSVMDIACTYDYAATEQDEETVEDETVFEGEEGTAPGEEEMILAEDAEPIADAGDREAVDDVTLDGAAASEEQVEEISPEEPVAVTDAGRADGEQILADGFTSDPLLAVDEMTGEELFSASVSEDGLSLIVSLKDDSESNYWRCSIGDISVLQLEESSLTDFMDGADVGSLTDKYTAVFKARVRADGTVKPGESLLTFSLVKNSTDKVPLTYFTLIVAVDENGLISVEAGDVPYAHTY